MDRMKRLESSMNRIIDDNSKNMQYIHKDIPPPLPTSIPTQPAPVFNSTLNNTLNSILSVLSHNNIDRYREDMEALYRSSHRDDIDRLIFSI